MAINYYLPSVLSGMCICACGGMWSPECLNLNLILQLLKVETGHQKHAVEQAKLRLLRKFQDWWAAQLSCCITGEGEEDAGGAATADQEGRTSPPRPRSCQGPRPVRSAPPPQHIRPWSAGPPCGACHPPPQPAVVSEESGKRVTTIWTRRSFTCRPQDSKSVAEDQGAVRDAALDLDLDQDQDQDQDQQQQQQPQGLVAAKVDDAAQAQAPVDDEQQLRNCIALTGDPEVDQEIIEFYKARNRICQT